MVKVCIRKDELELILKIAERTAQRTNGRVVIDNERVTVIDDLEQPSQAATNTGRSIIQMH
jgi:hypothetical protein